MEKLNNKIRRVCTIRAKFRVWQHVRISKENKKFPKSAKDVLVGK